MAVSWLMLLQVHNVASLWAPPRLLSIPALLSLAAFASVAVFSEAEDVLLRELKRRQISGASDLALQRTRLASTFLAVNIFFWFADPTLGLWDGSGGQLVRSLVLGLSSIWIARGWNRSPDAYRRETLSVSLREQLQPFEQQLKPALDGRSLQELTPSEVFLLARALPSQEQAMAPEIYRNVLEDLLRSGRLDSASALLYLQELRASLNLTDQEHHAAIRDIAARNPQLMALTSQQQQVLDLRTAAAKEALADLIDTGSAIGSLELDALTLRQRQRLERIRLNSGLDDLSWGDLLASFNPDCNTQSPLIQRSFAALEHLFANRQQLEHASSTDFLLRPLIVALDLQILSELSQLLPAISDRIDSQSLERWQRLRASMPASLEPHLALRGLALPELQHDTSTHPDAALYDWTELPALEDVLRELWQDPDPATAAWALRCLQRRDASLASALQRQPRLGASAQDSLDRLQSPNQALTAHEQGWCQALANDPQVRQATPADLLHSLDQQPATEG